MENSSLKFFGKTSMENSSSFGKKKILYGKQQSEVYLEKFLWKTVV